MTGTSFGVSTNLVADALRLVSNIGLNWSLILILVLLHFKLHYLQLALLLLSIQIYVDALSTNLFALNATNNTLNLQIHQLQEFKFVTSAIISLQAGFISFGNVGYAALYRIDLLSGVANLVGDGNLIRCCSILSYLSSNSNCSIIKLFFMFIFFFGISKTDKDMKMSDS